MKYVYKHNSNCSGKFVRRTTLISINIQRKFDTLGNFSCPKGLEKKMNFFPRDSKFQIKMLNGILRLSFPVITLVNQRKQEPLTESAMNPIDTWLD